MIPIDAGANQAELGRRGRFVPNLVSNFLNFGVTFGLGIWFTPYLINNLGAAHFGLIPLATAVASYMTIVTNSLNISTARFLTLELEKKNFARANSLFNASLYSSLAAIVVLGPIAGIFSIQADKFIRTPEGAELQTRILFFLASSAFLLGTVFSPFGVSTFCLNRFDIRNFWGITRNVIRVGLVVTIFSLYEPRIWHVSFALLLATLVEGLGLIWSWRQLTPILNVSLKLPSWQAIKEVCSTGGWTMLTQAGTILFLGLDLLIINRLLGTEQAGRYASILQWSAILRTVAATIATVFAPNIMAFFARDDIDGLTLYTKRSIKFVGLALALPIGLLCGFSTPLLTVWLGTDFSDLDSVFVLMIAPLAVNLAVLPIFSLLLSYNAIKTPGYVTLLMGIINVLLAISFLHFLHWGLHGMAAANAIALTAKNLIFFPLYAAHKTRKHPWVFYDPILSAVAGATLLWIMASLANRYIAIESWPTLCLVSAILCILFAPVAYFFVLNAEERKDLLKVIKNSGIGN